MNQKTARLIGKAVRSDYGTRTYLQAKKFWNQTPRPQRRWRRLELRRHILERA